MQWLNRSVDILSEFLAHRKGLLPLLGILLILVNYILQFLPRWGGSAQATCSFTLDW